MQFFSGFSLKNEAYLFEEYRKRSDYSIAGFSYGAIKALQNTLERLKNNKRVDTLQLFSPAFFQTKELKFQRLQLMSYKKNEQTYMKQFVKACFHPYESRVVEHIGTTKEDLEELLGYEWTEEVLQYIVQSGVTIEVYLGAKDAIIDVESARKFFLKVATVTYVKDANHFLQTK